MPLRDYSCRSCEHRFEALVKHDETPVCPSCGGQDLQKLLSVFAKPAGDSGDAAPGTGCGTCGDPRGPGACGWN